MSRRWRSCPTSCSTRDPARRRACRRGRKTTCRRARSHTIADTMKDGKRVVLAAIEPNEPVLSVKITGAGQRATLSALVRDGMKAVTIRVNDVEGVGGFVLPGDRVDVVLTRQVDKNRRATRSCCRNARAGDRPVRRRTRRQTDGRQGGDVRSRHGRRAELSLRSSVGKLSLMLRKAGETAPGRSAHHARGSRQHDSQPTDGHATPSWSAAAASKKRNTACRWRTSCKGDRTEAQKVEEEGRAEEEAVGQAIVGDSGKRGLGFRGGR